MNQKSADCRWRRQDSSKLPACLSFAYWPAGHALWSPRAPLVNALGQLCIIRSFQDHSLYNSFFLALLFFSTLKRKKLRGVAHRTRARAFIFMPRCSCTEAPGKFARAVPPWEAHNSYYNTQPAPYSTHTHPLSFACFVRGVSVSRFTCHPFLLPTAKRVDHQASKEIAMENHSAMGLNCLIVLVSPKTLLWSIAGRWGLYIRRARSPQNVGQAVSDFDHRNSRQHADTSLI